MMNLHSVAITITALVASTWFVQTHADVINVPGDYAELQEAVNNASPGDTIRVTGTVQTPLHIFGDITVEGTPHFDIANLSAATITPPVIVDDATVIGARLLGGQMDWFYIPFVPTTRVIANNALLIDVVIHSTFWWSSPFSSGGGLGMSALTSDGSVLVDCVIEGGSAPFQWYDTPVSSGTWPAVIGNSVALLDCEVTGAPGGRLWGADVLCGGTSGGEGGDAVNVDTFYDYGGNTLTPGLGEQWLSYVNNQVCIEPNGNALVANQNVDLTGSRFLYAVTAIDPFAPSLPSWGNFVRVPTGTSFTLFSSATDIGFLYASDAKSQFTNVMGFGYGLLQLPPLVIIGPVLSPFSLSYTVPDNPAWIGLNLHLQHYDFTSGVSAPVILAFE